jgi:photosystem II stability/assembly factor-like uncharacterized protein
VVEFAYDAVDPNLVYAATNGTGLWKSADGGASWREATSFPGDEITSVAAHPDVPNTVYARCEDPEHHGMPAYVSRDAGENWEELPPCDNCGRLLFSPPDPGKPPYALYTWARSMASEDGSVWPAGLHRSMDGGYTWEQVEGAPTTDIYSLAAGNDDERVVVYIGISGGVVSPQSQAAAAADVIPGQGEIIPGGVYRLTSRLLNQRVYLPLVLRGYTPQ